MEEELFTVQDIKEYLQVNELDAYALMKSSEIKAWKETKGKGRKWLATKSSVEEYKHRLERGEVIRVRKEEEYYTVTDAAKMLGVDVGTIYRAKNLDIFRGTKNETGFYSLSQHDIDKVKEYLISKEVVKQEQAIELTPLPAKAEKPNDGKLLQDILSSTFSFLAEHSFAITFQSIEEVDAALRLWIVKTPDTTLNIVASGQQVTVLSEVYQKQLEEKSATLSQQLRKSETTLAILREKKREVILKEYAHDLSVWIEPRSDGFLVWCDRFPFSAMEKSEEEAFAAFRRTLWGYTCWLRNHQEKLTAEMKTQFEALKGLLVEE